jgi:acetyltransferase-like isoleucine patch superfamily enzyme
MRNKGYFLDDSLQIDDPDRQNRKELLEFYKLKGFFGNLKLNYIFFKSWIFQQFAAIVPMYDWAVKFQRIRGVNIGKHVFIGPQVMLDLLYPQLITFEDYVSVGMNCSFFVHGNPTNCVWIKEKVYPRYVKPIKIERGTWIAPNCIFLPGITIGHHCVIGAGSVVTKSFEPYSIIAGNPAKLIKKIDSEKYT